VYKDKLLKKSCDSVRSFFVSIELGWKMRLFIPFTPL